MTPNHSFQPTRPLRRGSLRSVNAVGRAAELRIRRASELTPKVSTPSARAIERQRWLAPALVAALLYPVVGIVFAFWDSSSAASPVRFWRLAAWVVSAAVFCAHLLHERRRLHDPPLRGAWHAACGVALGAFGLAIWVLVHGQWLGKTQNPTAPLALVLFPLVTGIPAFLAGLATLAVASRLRRNR